MGQVNPKPAYPFFHPTEIPESEVKAAFDMLKTSPCYEVGLAEVIARAKNEVMSQVVFNRGLEK